jgi:hypothetical protein
VSVRMYEGNAAALRGFEKNVLLLLGPRWWLAPVLPVPLWLLFFAGPLAFALGVVGRDWPLAGAGALLYLAQYLCVLTLRRWHALSAWRLLTFPLIAVSVTWCAWVAFARRLARGTVRWRGREVRVSPPA